MNKNDHTTELLARSIFALLFIGALISGLVYLWLWTDSPRIFYTQPAVQNMFFAVYAIGLIALVILCRMIWRRSEAQMRTIAGRIVAIFAVPVVALPTMILILEGSILAAVISGQKLSTIKLPIFFICWGILLLIGLLIIHRESLQRILAKLSPVASATATTLIILGALALIYTLNVELSQRIITGYALETYHNPFLATAVEWAQEYWDERNIQQTQWMPYVYYRREPYTGSFITVNEQGLRATENFVAPDTGKPLIHFFGGSSIWGEGARDAYTIPSQIARLLHEANRDATVMNFGESGYVSMQDILTFQTQLLKGNVPDIAVFYHGFNDIFSAHQQGYAGLPQNEINRYTDFAAGQDRRGSVFRLIPPDAAPDRVDFTLVSEKNISPQAIAARYLAQAKLLRSIAEGFDVQLLIIWHPTIHHKLARHPHEQTEMDRFEELAPGFFDLYQEVDAIIAESVANGEDLLWLANLFADRDDLIFFDKVHITEEANAIVAKTLLPHILELLNRD